MLGHFSRVQPFATSWTLAHQAPLSMGFSRQEYCSGLPHPPAGDLPDPGTEPTSPMTPALYSFFTTSAIWENPNDIQADTKFHGWAICKLKFKSDTFLELY